MKSGLGKNEYITIQSNMTTVEPMTTTQVMIVQLKVKVSAIVFGKGSAETTH